MKFWDASVLVALCVDEPHTTAAKEHLSADPHIVAWVGSRSEIMSALCRRRRENVLSEEQWRHAVKARDRVLGAAVLVSALDDVLDIADRLLATHALRAADAHQLAAALTAVEHAPLGHDFLSFDLRLNTAAGREGFTIPLVI